MSTISADTYPSAEVIGNDLTPIQPTNVPPNLKFIIDDFEDDWGYERDPFDYIHARYLATAVKDWPRLVQQAFKYVFIFLPFPRCEISWESYSCVKPGGWVEFQDWDTKIYSADGSLTKEHTLYMYHEYACTRRNEAGYTTQPGPHLEKWVRDAGFINVQAHKLPIPLGAWPKDKKFVRAKLALKPFPSLCFRQEGQRHLIH